MTDRKCATCGLLLRDDRIFYPPGYCWCGVDDVATVAVPSNAAELAKQHGFSPCSHCHGEGIEPSPKGEG